MGMIQSFLKVNYKFVDPVQYICSTLAKLNWILIFLFYFQLINKIIPKKK